jgi:fimbrial chaperone protein
VLHPIAHPDGGGLVVTGLRVLVLIAFALSQGAAVSAGEFTLNRVQIFLSGKTRSEMIVVRNNSTTETLRFQLTVVAWDQDRRGEMVLAPTKDIVFFPPLFTLVPGQERNVRVGATTPPSLKEKTYRLFIEELPAGAAVASESGQVRVLTKMGVPIFQQPTKPVGNGRIEGLTLQGGVVSFQVQNAGNAHIVVQQIRITGLGVAGEVVLQGVEGGWYILAGGTRAYEIPLPAGQCADVKAVSVEIQTAEVTVAGRVDAASGACKP